MTKFLTPDEAVKLVKDGDTLATGGFVNSNFPETLAVALEKRFVETNKPTDLTLVYAAGQGDGKEKGLNHLGHEKLLKRVIGGHWNLVPKIGALSTANKIEAYNLPQGTISQLYRDIAGHRIGTITHVGLKTFVDPRLDGGKINDVTKEDIVELVKIGGKELLLYKAFPINVCFLRGTYADEKGNITMEKEGVTLDSTSMAQATKNSGGIVIVQVQGIVKAGTLDPKMVIIPHIYVDAVVCVPALDNMPEQEPSMIDIYSGNKTMPAGALPALPMSERKIIARRAAMELTKDSVVNLGIGMPETVAMVANEEGIGDYMTLTVEAGPVGGIPAGGGLFGVTINGDCFLDQAYQFDFYDGGGLDLAFLGLAECDQAGNINVSKLGARIPGCGGFINITQNAKKVFYLGTFTAKGLKIAAGDGKLTILQEGSAKKFLKKVRHVTFSGEYALEVGQPVMYITERAVFELKKDGLHLTEIAPGVDLEKDVLAYMDFKPIIPAGGPKLMDARIFKNEPMGLAK